jgi:hypothetical protein
MGTVFLFVNLGDNLVVFMRVYVDAKADADGFSQDEVADSKGEAGLSTKTDFSTKEGLAVLRPLDLQSDLKVIFHLIPKMSQLLRLMFYNKLQ